MPLSLVGKSIINLLHNYINYSQNHKMWIIIDNDIKYSKSIYDKIYINHYLHRHLRGEATITIT